MLFIKKKSFLKRFFCDHLNWSQGRLNGSQRNIFDDEIIMGKGKITPWTCNKCGTCKQFTGVEPIQMMVNE